MPISKGQPVNTKNTQQKAESLKTHAKKEQTTRQDVNNKQQATHKQEQLKQAQVQQDVIKQQENTKKSASQRDFNNKQENDKKANDQKNFNIKQENIKKAENDKKKNTQTITNAVVSAYIFLKRKFNELKSILIWLEILKKIKKIKTKVIKQQPFTPQETIEVNSLLNQINALLLKPLFASIGISNKSNLLDTLERAEIMTGLRAVSVLTPDEMNKLILKMPLEIGNKHYAASDIMTVGNQLQQNIITNMAKIEELLSEEMTAESENKILAFLLSGQGNHRKLSPEEETEIIKAILQEAVGLALLGQRGQQMQSIARPSISMGNSPS